MRTEFKTRTGVCRRHHCPQRLPGPRVGSRPRRLAAALAAALALGACARPSLQPPGDAIEVPRLEAGSAVMADGYRLPYWRWLPGSSPRYVVVALHGFNDYRSAFAGPAAGLAARGVAVYAFDQRGFGETEHRGLWPGTDRLVSDAGAFLELVRQRHPDRPLALLGMSMGAAVALMVQASTEPAPADALVLVAPAAWGRQTMNPLMRAGLWLLVHLAPGSHWTGEALDIRPTDNLNLLRAMARDPLVIKQTRADAIWGLTGLMDQALDAAHRVPGPLLVLHGGKDQVVPRSSVCRLIHRLQARGQPPRVHFYPHGHHMLMRDLAGDRVVADIAAWLQSRTRKPTRALPGCDQERPRAASAGP